MMYTLGSPCGGYGSPVITTALPLASAKSNPSLTLPLHTAKMN